MWNSCKDGKNDFNYNVEVNSEIQFYMGYFENWKKKTLLKLYQLTTNIFILNRALARIKKNCKIINFAVKSTNIAKIH